MGQFHKIEEMLTGELMKIGSEGKLTNTSLEVGDKAAHFLKSIKTIEAMDEEGSNYYDGYGYDSMSYGRGRYAKRDSMGRYADSGSKHELMQELDEMRRRVEHMEG